MSKTRFISILATAVLCSAIFVSPQYWRWYVERPQSFTVSQTDTFLDRNWNRAVSVRWVLLRTSSERQKTGEPKECRVSANAEITNLTKDQTFIIQILKVGIIDRGFEVWDIDGFLPYDDSARPRLELKPEERVVLDAYSFVPVGIMQEKAIDSLRGHLAFEQ